LIHLKHQRGPDVVRGCRHQIIGFPAAIEPASSLAFSRSVEAALKASCVFAADGRASTIVDQCRHPNRRLLTPVHHLAFHAPSTFSSRIGRRFSIDE
jgi:hypothetical protein